MFSGFRSGPPVLGHAEGLGEDAPGCRPDMPNNPEVPRPRIRTFVASTTVVVKVLAMGLAAAAVIDASIVHLLLVPAFMMVLGHTNWWLPGWLDRHPAAPASREHPIGANRSSAEPYCLGPIA